MRFMIIVKATRESEAGVMPSEKLLGDMMKFNEAIVRKEAELRAKSAKLAKNANR